MNDTTCWILFGRRFICSRVDLFLHRVCGLDAKYVSLRGLVILASHRCFNFSSCVVRNCVVATPCRCPCIVIILIHHYFQHCSCIGWIWVGIILVTNDWKNLEIYWSHPFHWSVLIISLWRTDSKSIPWWSFDCILQSVMSSWTWMAYRRYIFLSLRTFGWIVFTT